MKTRCLIVAGGDCNERLFKSVSDDCFVIAADSGLLHCQSTNIMPDLVVGDFDSYTDKIPYSCQVIKLPVHKDDTDLHFAARCGIDKGFKDFTIFGGYGSRPDQNFAMISTLLFISRATAGDVKAICKDFEFHVITESTKIFYKDSAKYLSVFPLDGNADGVTIKGAEYPLEDAVLTSDFPIGVSNCLMCDTTVSVKKGSLLIMLVNKNL